MNQQEPLKNLLEKFRDNALTRKEFDRLAAMVNDPASKDEIKFWLGELWPDTDTGGEIPGTGNNSP